ncbi:MAG: hypothetical protein K0S33_788 [Bacteroidetes bacterium]|jgi:hypothetical protein|nr:hypothetical protein [Bacteroidota bacterium]
MKTEEELNRDIIKITAMIREKFPELSKFIGEMPVKVSYTDGADPNLKGLNEYYNSLETLVKKYADNHE